MRDVGGVGTVDLVVRAVLEELPELAEARVRVAVERGFARAASAALNTEGHRIIDLHLARVEATEESTQRATILRELSTSLEDERGDAERAFAVRIAACAEAPDRSDVAALLRLARLTQRWSELPLESLTALVTIDDDDAIPLFLALGDAWTTLGRAYAAADCYERVLALQPANEVAYDALELFYRSTSEWPTLVDLLARRAVHAPASRTREAGAATPAELFRDIAAIYEQHLGDPLGALDAYREADRLAPDHPGALAGLARLAVELGDPDGEAVAALERLAAATPEPSARAAVLVRGAAVAKLADWDRAQRMLEAARQADPDCSGAIDALAELGRDRGELESAIVLLEEAAARPALIAHRSRWLTEAADLAVATGDLERGTAWYRAARTADPTNHEAGVALVELHMDTGSLVELAPILDELCRTTTEPRRLHGYLVQRGCVASELGDHATRKLVLARAVALEPTDRESALALSGMLYEGQEWRAAVDLIEALLVDEDLLPTAAPIELHFQAARAAQMLGELERAMRHAGVTLALAPDHRGALLMRTELDTADPLAHAAAELALANVAPLEEQGARFAALGLRYLALGDRATAIEMTREALARQPKDHLLLAKQLELVTEAGDWSYALDLVQRLVETERDATIRARYRTLAGRIARDELHAPERAAAELAAALDDDPMQFDAADELEALLAADGEARLAFLSRRLEHVRTDEGRAGERLRLWDQLAQLCLARGRRHDAIAALEVGLSLAPPDADLRRRQLADLLTDADDAHLTAAIDAHLAVLALDPRRARSYAALRTLYGRASAIAGGRRGWSAACTEALAVLRTLAPSQSSTRATGPVPTLGVRATGVTPLLAAADAAFFDELFAAAPVDAEPEVVASKPLARALGADDWAAVARLDVDPLVSGLLALVAPAFAIDRARLRPPVAMPAREPELPPVVARVLARVVAVIGCARPPVLLDREQRVACRVVMRAHAGQLAPALAFGAAALASTLSEHELTFRLARVLADLRADRIARLLCPRPAELAQVLELVPTSRWLGAALHQLELEQARAMAARLAERGDKPLRTALDWLAATERVADRVGFIVAGDLAACALDVAAADAAPDRALQLVRASVTPDLLGVRERV